MQHIFAAMNMTSLGAVEYRRPRYRRDGASSSIVPVDECLLLKSRDDGAGRIENSDLLKMTAVFLKKRASN